MAFEQWQSSIAVGIEAVDDEHRKLIDAIDALQAVLEDDESGELPLVTRVARIAQTHFASEEAAMVKLGYPGATLHTLKHEYLMQQILAFAARCSRNASVLNRYSLNFLRDIVSLHIRNEDTNFGLWLREQVYNKAAQPADISKVI